MKLINALKKYQKLGFQTVTDRCCRYKFFAEEVRIDEMIEFVKKFPNHFSSNAYSCGGDDDLSACIGSPEHFWEVRDYDNVKTEKDILEAHKDILGMVYRNNSHFYDIRCGAMKWNIALELKKRIENINYSQVWAEIAGKEVISFKCDIYFAKDSLGRRVPNLYELKIFTNN